MLLRRSSVLKSEVKESWKTKWEGLRGLGAAGATDSAVMTPEAGSKHLPGAMLVNIHAHELARECIAPMG